MKRPGAEVRARRGYLAASVADITATRAREAASAAAGTGASIAAAVSPLALYAREVPVRLRAAAAWTPQQTATIWTVGEVGSGDWLGGADADLVLTDAAGATVATSRAQIAPGTRSFKAAFAGMNLAPGDYAIRVRLRSRRPDAAPTGDSVRITIPPSPVSSGALIVRRGPTTGNREAPAADARFRRSEQIRVEVPAAAASPPAVRLLDRTGKPLPLPVTGGVREESDGSILADRARRARAARAGGLRD